MACESHAPPPTCASAAEFDGSWEDAPAVTEYEALPEPNDELSEHEVAVRKTTTVEAYLVRDAGMHPNRLVADQIAHVIWKLTLHHELRPEYAGLAECASLREAYEMLFLEDLEHYGW